MQSRGWVSKYTWVGQCRGRRTETDSRQREMVSKNREEGKKKERKKKKVREGGTNVSSKPIILPRS